MKILEPSARVGVRLAGLYSVIGNMFALSLPLYAMQVMDRVLSGQSTDTLFVLSLGVSLALILSATLFVLRSRTLQRVALLVEEGLLPRVIARQARANALFGGQERDAVAYLRIATTYISGNGYASLFDLFLVPAYLLFVVLIDLRLGLLMLVALTLLFVLTYLARRILLTADLFTSDEQDATNLLAAHSRMSLVLEVLGVSNRAAYAVARGRGDQRLNQLAAQDSLDLYEGLARFVSLSFNATILGIGAYLVIKQELSAGALIAALILGLRTLSPVESYLRNQRGRELYRRALENLTSLLNDSRLEVPSQAIIEAPRGDLRISNLVYAYPGVNSPVLKGVTLAIREGASIGVTGNSGSGKSTLARLVLGLYTPSSGKVMMGNLDLAQVNRSLLGTHIGFVDQGADLMPMSIADNISRFHPAPIDEVIAAARKAGAHEMIERLPKGYQTQIIGNGSNLSGGQRQLICLARALFGNPALIVLDEPSSMLDSQERQKIVGVINRLRTEHVTVIVISHDEHILRHLSSVLRLRNGSLEAVQKNAGQEEGQ